MHKAMTWMQMVGLAIMKCGVEIFMIGSIGVLAKWSISRFQNGDQLGGCCLAVGTFFVLLSYSTRYVLREIKIWKGK